MYQFYPVVYIHWVIFLDGWKPHAVPLEAPNVLAYLRITLTYISPVNKPPREIALPRLPWFFPRRRH